MVQHDPQPGVVAQERPRTPEILHAVQHVDRDIVRLEETKGAATAGIGEPVAAERIRRQRSHTHETGCRTVGGQNVRERRIEHVAPGHDAHQLIAFRRRVEQASALLHVVHRLHDDRRRRRRSAHGSRAGRPP